MEWKEQDNQMIQNRMTGKVKYCKHKKVVDLLVYLCEKTVSDQFLV